MSGPRMWVCLATLTGTGLAAAQPLAWNNPAGGDWSVPANWSPQQTPTTLSNVQLGLSGPFTVRLGTFSASCATLAIPNPVATLDIRMNETLRVTATAASLPIEGTVLVGDGQFGNPSVLDMTSPGTAAFTGAGRLVLNARRELVLPFADGKGQHESAPRVGRSAWGRRSASKVGAPSREPSPAPGRSPRAWARAPPASSPSTRWP
jgi:hypothetical protein